MEGLVVKIATSLPNYLMDSASLFFRPIEYVSVNSGESDDNYNRALQFVIISICISVILSYIMGHKDVDVWRLIIGRTIIAITCIISTSYLLWRFYKIAGSKTGFRAFFVAYSYPYGLGLVMSSVLTLFISGFLLWYMGIIREEQLADHRQIDSTKLEEIQSISKYFANFIVGLWWLCVWKVFETVSGIGQPKSGRVFIAFCIIGLPLAMIQVIFLSQLIAGDTGV
jgi:hypothetical protein